MLNRNGKQRRPRLESAEEFNARLERQRERFRNPERHYHEDLIRGLQAIVDAHQRRREQESQ
jgi:hypothetical protein